MSYHLDTSVAVHLSRGRPAYVRDRFRAALGAGMAVAISQIVLFELWYGVARSPDPRRTEIKLDRFLAGMVTVLPFEPDDARAAGELRQTLRKQPIGPYDLLIAAQALRAGATLATGNVREFSRVPGLEVEDWTA